MVRAAGKPDKHFWVAALRHEGSALRSAVSPDMLDRPVPTCPEWTVGDLVGHVAGLYEWVGEHVSRGVTSAPEARLRRPPAAEALSAFDQSYESIVAILDRLDPEFPAWNPEPQPKRAAFWHRRMAHETAVHRWDAQVSSGLTEPIETKLAVDGITEVIDTMLLTRSDPSAQPQVGIAALVATDSGDEWLVRVRPAGVALLDTSTITHEEHRIAARAAGSASDLMLALWGRIPFDVLQVGGDLRLLTALRYD